MARPKNASLTREKVVDAALALIGERGLEAFSMPKLAAALGVRAPSLYHYFADKDALLTAVARVVATPAAPTTMPADADWTDYLIAQSVALRSRIIAYPHCAPLLVRFMSRDNMFGEYEQMCQFLSASGVPSRLHIRIVDGLTALTLGAAMLGENAADYADSGDGPTPDPRGHPALRAALDAIEGVSADELFAIFLRTYLDGILREVPSRQAP
jgi:TetR/AcrR family transcriptional regulator, tetracycline repressor protein